MSRSAAVGARGNPRVGRRIIRFIPGAKVDPDANLYKLSGIVEAGVAVVMTRPTLNLAFFDQRMLTLFTADVRGDHRGPCHGSHGRIDPTLNAVLRWISAVAAIYCAGPFR